MTYVKKGVGAQQRIFVSPWCVAERDTTTRWWRASAGSSFDKLRMSGRLRRQPSQQGVEARGIAAQEAR